VVAQEGRANSQRGAKFGTADRWGAPASVKTEYAEHGITLTGGNNDRAAGYARMLELLHVEPGRLPPAWARVPASAGGAPRLYVVKICEHLIEQLKSAPVQAEGLGGGECVDPSWESRHGQAHAAARYGAMSRPRVAAEPPLNPGHGASSRADVSGRAWPPAPARPDQAGERGRPLGPLQVGLDVAERDNQRRSV
jgi:hypothetical protein